MANRVTRAGMEGTRRLTIHTRSSDLTTAEIIQSGTHLDRRRTYHFVRRPVPHGIACGACDAGPPRAKGLPKEDPLLRPSSAGLARTGTWILSNATLGDGCSPGARLSMSARPNHPGSSTKRYSQGLIAAALYVGTVFAANWAISRFGIVPVGFGLLATGRCLFRRVGIHPARSHPRSTWAPGCAPRHPAWCRVLRVRVAAIRGGLRGGIPALGTGRLRRLTPLREKHWLSAVALSNTVGLVLDSVIFLSLAFGSLAFLPGQIVGKAWMTAAAVVVLWLFRNRFLRRLDPETA